MSNADTLDDLQRIIRDYDWICYAEDTSDRTYQDFDADVKVPTRCSVLNRDELTFFEELGIDVTAIGSVGDYQQTIYGVIES